MEHRHRANEELLQYRKALSQAAGEMVPQSKHGVSVQGTNRPEKQYASSTRALPAIISVGPPQVCKSPLLLETVMSMSK